MLYFRPAANKITATARMIAPAGKDDWGRLLRTLAVGEFIAVGNFLIGNKIYNGALKVSAFEDKAPMDDITFEAEIQAKRKGDE